MAQICPRCGKSDVEFIDGKNICKKCFMPEFNLPSKFEFVICSRCGRLKHGEWKKPTTQNLTIFFISRSGIKGMEIVSLDTKTGDIVVSKEIAGIKYIHKGHIKLVMAKALCDDCSRKIGGYFEAIVQLRGNSKKTETAFRRLIEILQHDSFVSKAEDVPGGKDIYCGSKTAVFNAMHQLKLKFKTTRKLFGKKDGREVYRTTFAVRFE